MLIMVIAISSYPAGSVLLLLWTSGIFGVIGLVRSWSDTATKTALRLRTDVTLLSLGVVAALIFLALSAAALHTSPMMIVLVLFPLMPIVVAGLEIHKALLLMRGKPLLDTAKMRNFWLVLFLVPVALASGRILSQEIIILWHGHDLVPAAYAAAEKLAAGAPYCVVDYGGADSFEEMDKRTIILDAIKKRVGIIGPGVRNPHFGIVVNGKPYWWSFKHREFRQLHPQFPGLSCR